MAKAWFCLIISGIFEIVWTLGLRHSAGFTKLTPSIITIVAMIISFLLFSYSLKTIPLGTAYAAWVGLGICGVSIFGILFLSEPSTILRLGSILLILVGVTGLKLYS